MGTKSSFNLDPEQLNELLALGAEGINSDIGVNPDISRVAVQKLGTWVGQYKLVGFLGEGGMAYVYLAEQEYPIQRKVALKLIKPGMDSTHAVARFEVERQTLALLDHLNIAHIYDAGTTDSGQPYFAMEYVEGLAITEHCDRHQLTIDERLKLFLQICHAVHYAHQKGIIHRDIKPSNILVSYQDGQAIPKIIDFGVAKAINQPLTERTLFTEQGQLFGTPEYMSPEQADMASEDIDTRSDIYSLGVLLYVLLTGVLPFDSQTLRKGGVEHIRQVIRKTDPKTPSARLSSLGEKVKQVAQSRRIEVATLAKRLHKELEWIPLKAMHKQRSDRYRSASELADDIENYLEGKPLIAGPPGTVYQLKKLIRRHQALVAGIAAVLLVLILGIVASMVFAIKANNARNEAQAVSHFLRSSVLASLDPFKVGGKEISIRSVWDAASENLQGKFKNIPLAEAEIHDTLGNGYWSLGLYKQAELHLKRSWDIQQAQRGLEHLAALASAHQLGWVYFAQCRYSEAEKFLTHASQSRRRLLGKEHRDTIYSTAALACVYTMQGRFQKAEELLKKTLEITRRVWGEEDPYVPAIMNALALNFRVQGRYADSEELARQGLGIARHVLDENDWFTLLLKHNIARVCVHLGHYDEAEHLLLQVLRGRQQVWGLEHPDTLETMNTLGRLYRVQGRYEEAESHLDQALKHLLQVLGDAHIITAECMYERGSLYLSQGQYDKAEPLLNKVLKIMEHILGEENWASPKATNALAKLYTAQGRYDQARTLLLNALDVGRRVLGEEHPDTLTSMNDLAVLYRKQNQYEEAELLMLKALNGRRLRLGDTHPHTLESWHNLIDLYEAWNKPEKAKEWRARLTQKEDFEK
jgi:serine/threonine protein kinase